jgi:hypothetical protein
MKENKINNYIVRIFFTTGFLCIFSVLIGFLPISGVIGEPSNITLLLTLVFLSIPFVLLLCSIYAIHIYSNYNDDTIDYSLKYYITHMLILSILTVIPELIILILNISCLNKHIIIFYSIRNYLYIISCLFFLKLIYNTIKYIFYNSTPFIEDNKNNIVKNIDSKNLKTIYIFLWLIMILYIVAIILRTDSQDWIILSYALTNTNSIESINYYNIFKDFSISVTLILLSTYFIYIRIINSISKKLTIKLYISIIIVLFVIILILLICGTVTSEFYSAVLQCSLDSPININITNQWGNKLPDKNYCFLQN